MNRRMRTTVSVCKSTNGGKPCYLVRIPQHLQASEGATKKRFPRTREGEKAADALVLRLNNARQSWSAQLLAMRDQDQGRLLLMLEQVGGIDGLERAVADFKLRGQCVDKLFSQAITDFMAQSQAGSAHHYRSERVLLRFLELHPNKNVGAITNADFSAFLHGNGWQAKMQRYAYAVCRCFWEWCAHSTRRYAAQNIVLGTARPKDPKGKCEYYTVDEIAKLLRAAYHHDKNLITYIATGVFAGQRVSELCQMTAAMKVDGHFRLPAEITKTDHSRDVNISATLAAWLEIANDWTWTTGPKPELKNRADRDQWAKKVDGVAISMRKRLHAVAAIAGVSVKDNGLRHTYGTHNFALLGDKECAYQMGTGIDKLLSNYKHRHVSLAESKRYGSDELMPENVLKEQPENVIELQAAA